MGMKNIMENIIKKMAEKMVRLLNMFWLVIYKG